MFTKHSALFSFAVLAFISFFIHWPFFIKGLYPYPGNFQMAFFDPWRTDNSNSGVITLVHKAVADDVFRQLYPFKILAGDLFRQFQPPLWNPYNGAGMPLLATLNIGYFDPFNFLFLLFPSYLAWSLYIIIQPILVILATYIYCRKIGLSNFSSVFASVGFVLSGAVITRFVYGMYGLAIAAIPIILFLIESYINDKNSKLVFFLPVVLFSVIVSTQPQLSLYIIVFSALYFLARYYSSNKNFIGSTPGIIFIATLFIIGIFLAGVQIFPTLELFNHANISRESSQFIFDRFLIPLEQFVAFFIPNYYGNIGTYNYWGSSDFIESAMYIGLIPSFFIVLSIISLKKKKYIHKSHVVFFLTIVLTAFITTLAWEISQFIFSLPLPLVSTGIPTRIFIVASFAAAIMSGIGFEQLVNSKKERKILIISFAAFLLFMSALFGRALYSYFTNVPCPVDQIKNCNTVALRNFIFELGFLGALTIIFISFLKINNQNIKKFGYAVVILLIAISGLYNSYKFTPFSPRESFAPKNELITFLQTIPNQARVFGLGSGTITTNFATMYRFYDPQYYHPLYIKRYGELIGYANTGSANFTLSRSDVEIPNSILIGEDESKRRERLLQLIGVSHLFYKKSDLLKDEFSNFRLNNKTWENKDWVVEKTENVVPKVYFAKNVYNLPEKEILPRLFSNQFEPLSDVIVEGVEEKTYSAKGELNVKKYSEQSIELKTKSNEKQLLVVNDNYYPGWKAYIDGVESPIFRANYTFRAIVLPAGEHIVRFVYEPQSFQLGLLVSILSFVLLIILFILRLKNIFGS